MKSCEEGKEIATEIAELLPGATHEQKMLIKGVLIGINVAQKTITETKGKKAG